MTPPVKKNSALFLDIDGTLLDMARTPDAVIVPTDLQLSLVRLYDELEGALAFVSGRSLAAIDRLFAPLRTAAIGCHGVEVRGTDGNIRALADPIADPVRAIFRGLVESHPGTILEDKIYALALHYRLAPEAKRALEAAMKRHESVFAAEKVTIQHGKAVIDAKPLGVDKGVGLRALMRQAPFRDRAPIFGGDDTTDADVFHILPELGGHGFSVGRAFKGVDYKFQSPRAVRLWLTHLAQQGVVA
ncbi:MAG: trehalose-phosphatase [Pseudomonadota bacterium]